MSPSPEILPQLRERWSPRAFADREVSTQALEQLLEAARWAPSCYNDQPWFFVVGRRGHGDAYARLLETLIEYNQSWAATAPVLLLGLAREAFARNGKPNEHAWYDLGQAMGGLLAQATALSLSVHQMAGFDRAAAARTVGAPDGYSAVVAAAIGYLGTPDRLPADMTENDPAARERRPLAEFAFEGRWGEVLG
ncbi:MAG: nitroreductase family protein [Gammaproteobacteria bacterium]